jgi:phage repressor protein C with HTH and peptisase S24 domain
MAQTFKDRLKILMQGDRPYTWSKKVGIEKGLFQYYWQKGKIPTYENLLKIQNFSGCSLDWLLTGRSVAFEKVDKLPMVSEKTPKYGARNLRLSSVIVKVKDIYSKKSDKDVEAFEYFVNAVLNKKS